MVIEKKVANRFEDYIFDWDYERYLLIGGYGSGKSYDTAFKIILKLLQEKRKCLVVREVYETMFESTFDLFTEILEDMNLLASGMPSKKERMCKVIRKNAPMGFKFPNGSRIIFKGMDKPDKVKSINGISIVWLEECSEIKYQGYKELLGRIRTPDVSMHFILTCNPVARENWVYRHFFVSLDRYGMEHTIVDPETFYSKRTLIHKGTYYHHSTVDDNPWAPWQYIKRLDEFKQYDYPLYEVARFGRFGASGLRVLPQLQVAGKKFNFKENIMKLPLENHFFGMDFGFENSYNAVVSMAIDWEKSTLYIYDEIYENKITDDDFAKNPKMQALKDKLNEWYDSGINKIIVADNEDPKAIAYYQKQGFRMRSCHNKFIGSRLSNTRKIKRFKHIHVSPKCVNVIRELKELTYKQNSKGETIYDQFNIDPHTFSAIWYGLDSVDVIDTKKVWYSKDGEMVKRLGTG